MGEYNDGRIYAAGRYINIAPKEAPNAITMGGTIAEARDSKTAREIARRCQHFEPLLFAAEEMLACQRGTPTGAVVDLAGIIAAAKADAHD